MNSTFTILSNGLKVANFNSPHEFNFEDGTILKACSSAWSKETMLLPKDETTREFTSNGNSFQSVQKGFEMSDSCYRGLIDLADTDVDLIIVPFPVLQLVQASNQDLVKMKCCTGFLVDRVDKTLSIEKFCQ
jgi:hypothetical protein